MRILKWLYPGMGVKRWILLSVLGVILVGFGMVFLFTSPFKFSTLLGWILVSVGGVLVIFGMKKMVGRFIGVFLPGRKKDLVDIVYNSRQLDKGPNVVVIGGGHGLSVLLEGLKEYSNNIKAIVTVADDGGSSGRLREEFNVLPPGDIRNCLVALAEAPPLMRDLFQFRFSQGEGLKGHNFGNLFITALSKISGDFDEAIKYASRILAVRGEVIPSTLERVRLVAEHENGEITFGENNIPKSGLPIDKIKLSPGKCLGNEEAIDAIKEADAVVIGPGSLYTSIIPNLLVPNISKVLSDTKALKIYVCNVMTQYGETDGFSASDHVKSIIKHTGSNIIDYCVVNRGSIPRNLLAKYAEEDSEPVKVDVKELHKVGCKVVSENIISNTDYVRHNSKKLARTLMDIITNIKGLD